MKWITDFLQFLKDVAGDERIPGRDKKLILAMVALIVSPIDFIPDWIPIIGVIDDLFIIALLLDYLFDHLDSQILLSHYPWGMKSFIRIRRLARLVSWLTPNWVRHKIWAYKPDVYQ